jgi:hypothetical protein
MKFVQIYIYKDGGKHSVNSYPDDFNVIVNDGAKPDVPVPIDEPSLFIRPNGKVMGCPAPEAREIGDIYGGTLDLNSLHEYNKCAINGLVYCNALSNAYNAFR